MVRDSVRAIWIEWHGDAGGQLETASRVGVHCIGMPYAKSVFSSDGPDWKDEKDGRKVVECD